VASALGQTLEDVEVVVVDDGSVVPVELEPDPHVRVVRHDPPRGVPGARNAGLAAATGRYVTFLDDDNLLLPDMAERSLAAVEGSELPPPVAVVSGVEVVGRGGRVLDVRLPPSHPRGDHYSLEPLPPGRSHMSKHTLVAERELLTGLGGFDERLPTREMSDLLVRLNPVCSIEGLPEATMRLTRTGGPRVSRDSRVLEDGFRGFVHKHRALLEAHPAGYADVLLGHARMSLVAGPRRAAPVAFARALRVAPRHTLGVTLDPRRAVGLARTWSSSG
jgi:glycosyltransferase involved in cell wall biosynthesis